MLTGKATIELRRDAVTEGKKAARKAAAAARRSATDEADQALFQALRVRRSALAKAQAVPAYVVLPDRSLIDMAQPQARRRWPRWPRCTASARPSSRAMARRFWR